MYEAMDVLGYGTMTAKYTIGTDLMTDGIVVRIDFLFSGNHSMKGSLDWGLLLGNRHWPSALEIWFILGQL